MNALLSVALCTVCLLPCCSPSLCQPQSVNQQASVQTGLLTVIADHNASENKVMQAVSKLNMPATEPAQYWRQIANDAHYRRFQRRVAVYELFKRHVHMGMRLSDLTSLVQHPLWLRATDIDVIDEVIGKIPIALNSDDTDFVVRFLPDPHKDGVAVYLRVAGKIDKQQFQDCLLKVSKTSIRDAPILEVCTFWPSPR